MEWKNFEFLNGMINGIAMLTAAAAHSTHKSISFRSSEWAEWFDLIVDGQCGPRKQMKSIENWLVLFYWWGSEPINSINHSILLMIDEFDWAQWAPQQPPPQAPNNQTQQLISLIDWFDLFSLLGWLAALPPIPFLNFIQLFNSFAELKELMKWDGMALLLQRQRWGSSINNKFN